MRPVIFTLSIVALFAFKASAAKPNVLWIIIEDWSPDLSCYGTKGIHTPNVDHLAAEGIRYEAAFTTSPVCSTSCFAMMTGFHQDCIGVHRHREPNDSMARLAIPFTKKPKRRQCS